MCLLTGYSSSSHEQSWVNAVGCSTAWCLLCSKYLKDITCRFGQEFFWQ